MISPVKKYLRFVSRIVFAGFALFPALAFGFDIPNGVFTYSELNEARKHAFEEKEPIMLLYTDPKLKPS